MQFNQNKNRFGTRWAVLGVTTMMLTVGACADDDTDGGAATALEIIGTWADSYGGLHTISDNSWDDGLSPRSVQDFDNNANWVVTQNAPDDEYSPDMFNYVVWTDADANGMWWTCTVGYGIATLDEALAVPNTADDSDPATDGCGGFSWTSMTPAGG
jgi:hypothetical protein